MATTPDPLNPIRSQIATGISDAKTDILGATDQVKELAKQLGDTSGITKSIFENSTKIKNEFADTLSLAGKLGTEYLKADQITKRINENIANLSSVQSDINTKYGEYVNAQRRRGSDSIVEAQDVLYRRIENAIQQGNVATLQSLSSEELRVFLLMKQKKSLEKNAELLNEIENNLDAGNTQFTKMSVKATALAKIFAGLSMIPFLKEFMNFQIISDKFQKSTGAGFKELGSQIGSIFKQPLFWIAALAVALKGLINLAFDFDKIATDLSKNLGMSKDSTVDMLDSFRRVSAEGAKMVESLSGAFLSVKNQANAMLELQNTLETNAMFTNEMLQNQILLTKQMGMSAEEATGIQKLSLLTGQSAEKILKTSLEQNKTSISYRKIIGEIAKINAELSIAYKNNPELIAKAVVQANKLGMSLEQTQKIAKSLLDFETSISGELESELLLGRRFNFEKARALALDGKSAEAASELVTQIGGMNELTKMNVIQRERVAAAIGLSADELATAAKEQAVLNALGVQNRQALEERYELLRANNDQAGLARLQQEAANKEGGKALLQDITRANLQQRFTESVEQVKQIFTEMSTVLIPVLESIAKMLQNTTALKLIMASIAGIAAAIATSMVIATGGTALVGATIAGLAIGGGTYALMSSAGGQGEASLPTKRTNLPTASTGVAGQDVAQGSVERTTIVNLSMNGQDFATAIAKSNHTSGT